MRFEGSPRLRAAAGDSAVPRSARFGEIRSMRSAAVLAGAVLAMIRRSDERRGAWKASCPKTAGLPERRLLALSRCPSTARRRARSPKPTRHARCVPTAHCPQPHRSGRQFRGPCQDAGVARSGERQTLRIPTPKGPLGARGRRQRASSQAQQSRFVEVSNPGALWQPTSADWRSSERRTRDGRRVPEARVEVAKCRSRPAERPGRRRQRPARRTSRSAHRQERSAGSRRLPQSRRPRKAPQRTGQPCWRSRHFAAGHWARMSWL